MDENVQHVAPYSIVRRAHAELPSALLTDKNKGQFILQIALYLGH